MTYVRGESFNDCYNSLKFKKMFRLNPILNKYKYFKLIWTAIIF